MKNNFDIAVRRIANTLKRFLNRYLVVGLVMFVALVLTSVVGLAVYSHINPLAVGAFLPNLPPSIEHPLGTNSLGRDMLTGLFRGTLHSLAIGFIASTIGTSFGVFLGSTAGFFGGKTDLVLRTITDAFLVIPLLPVMVLIASFTTMTVPIMGLSFSIFTWAWSSRIVRSQILSLKRRDFVELARLSGMSEREILVKEILPHMVPWILSSFIFTALWVMINEAGVSFLGLGPFTDLTIGMTIYWALIYGSISRGLWWNWVPSLVMLILIFISLYIITLGFDIISREL
jgi:peptide/nickel transport system permease protein